MEVSIEFLLQLRSEFEDIIISLEEHRELRDIDDIVSDGDAPDSFVKLCQIVDQM